jgi:phenylpropionate dioxygenase-like ring-hydroxylating dioxygenase large terminal subunit
VSSHISLNGQLKPDLPSTHYLDNRIYSDQAIYERERDNIFGTQWKFACHESELPNARDFRVVTLAEKEIIIVRGEDSVLRAFYNACPHRGSKIIREVAGSLPGNRMTCFYHMWSFNTEGECLNVSQPEGYEACGIGKEGVNLSSVRVENLHGLIFICLDDDTAGLAEFLGPEVAESMRIPWAGDLEIMHFHRQIVNANWKLFVETNCEGYHELLHKLNRQTAVSVKGYGDRKWHVFPSGHTFVDAATISYEKYADLERSDQELPGMEPNGHVVVDLFPDTMLNCRATVARIDTMIPMGPYKTMIECRGFGLKNDSPELRETRIRHHNQVWGPTGTNIPEDVWAVEVQMSNMRSGGSRYSIIARDENGSEMMTDQPLRGFYEVWRRLVRANSHDIDEPYSGH